MTIFTNTQITVDDIPAVSSVEFSELHPKYRWVNLSSTFIWLAVPAIPLAVVLPKILKSQWSLYIWFAIAVIVCLSFVFSYYSAKVSRYALREHDILFQQGLFWQKTTAVAFNRIQHIDLTHGPMERKYQFSSLKFFTAGGSSVDLKIPGLPKDDAEQIRAMILSKINKDAAQDTSEDSSQGQEAPTHHDE